VGGVATSPQPIVASLDTRTARLSCATASIATVAKPAAARLPAIANAVVFDCPMACWKITTG